MIDARARGLASIHAVIETCAVGAAFWAWAFINWNFHVPFVHMNPYQNLVPYFLCVVGGMALSAREVSRRLAARFHLPDLGGSARLASRQVTLMAALVFTLMFATQDHGMSRLFLGSFLVFCWLGLVFMNAWLPGGLARFVFQKGHRRQQGAARHLPGRAPFRRGAAGGSLGPAASLAWPAFRAAKGPRGGPRRPGNPARPAVHGRRGGSRDRGLPQQRLPAPDPQQHRGALQLPAGPRHRGGQAFLHAPGGAARGPAEPPGEARLRHCDLASGRRCRPPRPLRRGLDRPEVPGPGASLSFPRAPGQGREGIPDAQVPVDV